MWSIKFTLNHISYIIYYIFSSNKEMKLRSQIFFMVGVWLSGVFIFAGDNNDNKYEAIKSNINSRNCFFLYWFWLSLQLKPKPCEKVTTIPYHLQPSSPILGLLTTLQVTLLTQRQSHFLSTWGILGNIHIHWSAESCWSPETIP